MIGRTIGKYRIVGQIGRGGAGIVYKAVDETLSREVAIKTLNPDFANTELMRRFRGEATILARLNHPCIATLYELFRAGDDLLMVMEFVRGESLDKLAERVGPLPPEQATYLVDRILTALEHAHRAGIVHRDMKPANVMVTEGGGVKIMDFGIARVRGAEQVTVDGRLMGTPAYMPPEQVLGQEVDGRADLYAVGVILYRLLTGALPFKADTAIAMMQRQILEPPEPLCAHRDGLPAWCAAIVGRALAKGPEDRFQTAEEFREALRQAGSMLATADFAQALVIAPAYAEPSSVTPLDARHPATIVSPVSPKRPRVVRWAVAAASVVAVAGLLGHAALQGPSAETVPPATASASTRAADVVLPTPVNPAPRSSAHIESRSTASAVAVAERVVVPDTPAPPRRSGRIVPQAVAAPEAAAAAVPAPAVEAPAPALAPAAEPDPITRSPEPRLTVEAEAPLVFETKALVGVKKPREHDAHLVLGDGKVTVTSELESEYPFYSIPYDSVVSITYSRGRDPMWNSPDGPAPVTRGGGTLGRLGIVVARDWIALRTNTKDQFITMRFDGVLVRRVLFALHERTGRKPELIAEPKEDQ